MAQHYELLYIISSSVAESDHEAIIKKVSGVITQEGGSISKEEPWGKQKLAYEIKHERYGSYVLVEFDSDGEMLKKLDSSLKLMPEIIRSLVIKKHVKSEAEVAHERMVKEKIEAKRVAKVQAEKSAVKEAEVKEKAEQRVEEEKKAAKTKSSDKISLEDLDEKLDEILKEEI